MTGDLRPVRVVIVEDEPAIARRIERFTRDLLEVEAIEICPTFDMAVVAIDRAQLDLLLLDLDVGGRDGFTLLDRATAGTFHTIVISAHSDRAIEAFDHGVLDFVAKPFDRVRLERAFGRLRDRLAGNAPVPMLAIRKHGAIVLVPVADIHYVRAAGPYAELVLRDGRTELHNKSLDALQRLLPTGFERTHRSYLVRIDDIVRVHVQEGSRYELELAAGDRLPIGRSRYAALLARLTPSRNE